MREFIEKLISKLEEIYNRNDKVKKKAYEEQDWEYFDLFMHRNEGVYTSISTVRQLAEEYRKAEEQGLLLRLPCKVGNELFLSDYPTIHCRLKEYKFIGNEVAIVIDCWEWQRTCTRMLSDFGKTIFLTKEEAEQALKQMKAGGEE